MTHSNSSSSSSLSYQGLPIAYEAATGLICLTDLWQAQCSPAKQRPLAWVRLEQTQPLLQRLTQLRGIEPIWSQQQRTAHSPQRAIVAIPGILETTEGEGILRTWATTELAVIYARFLGSECYEWALTHLAEGSGIVEAWAAQLSEEELGVRRQALSRRAVITAGWSIPVIATVALNQKAQAQISSGHNDLVDALHNDTAHNDTPHDDTPHNDITHDDTPHNDITHNDVIHDDAAHSDTAHTDTIHSDTAHTDTIHSDTAHSDTAHTDTIHSDIVHNDTTHGDVSHRDGPHNDATHTDAPHNDAAHTDVHNDAHNDANHKDSPHNDTAHGDTAHGDAHGDTPHDDAVHADAHGDISHDDAAHADAHSDAPHNDTNHSDNATHVDVPF